MKPNDILYQDEQDTFLLVESRTYGRMNFVVSTEDYHLVRDVRWGIGKQRPGKSFYVQRGVKTPSGNKTIRLHNIITGHTGKGHKVTVDHIDRQPLNNRRSNLRIATSNEQCINRGLMCNNTSGRTGVSYRKDQGVYRARIRVAGKLIVLGQFKQFDDAVAARAAAELKHFGEN